MANYSLSSIAGLDADSTQSTLDRPPVMISERPPVMAPEKPPVMSPEIGDGDVFVFSGKAKPGSRAVVEDLDFGDGDMLVFRGFARDTFGDGAGNDVVGANGSYARIDSIADLIELDHFSRAITTKVRGDDLAVTIAQKSGMHTYVLEGHGAEFRAGLDDLL